MTYDQASSSSLQGFASSIESAEDPKFGFSVIFRAKLYYSEKQFFKHRR